MSEEFYYAPEDALAELKRRKDAGVEKRVEEWWAKSGKEMPDLPAVSSPAVLARQLATGRFEDLLFQELAQSSGFTPTWWEYPGDRFSSQSALKCSYLHPRLCTGRNGAGEILSRRCRLARPHEWEKKALKEITTFSGEPLLDWHYRQRESVMGSAIKIEVPAAQQSYQHFMSLFIAHAVLFEDYHGGESGTELTRLTVSRFEPVWTQTYRELGLKPIIVPMPWWPELAYYPATPDWKQYGVVNKELFSSKPIENQPPRYRGWVPNARWDVV